MLEHRKCSPTLQEKVLIYYQISSNTTWRPVSALVAPIFVSNFHFQFPFPVSISLPFPAFPYAWASAGVWFVRFYVFPQEYIKHQKCVAGNDVRTWDAGN